MSREMNQKLRLVFLAKMLLEETDDRHHLTTSEIRSKLMHRNGISVTRQTLYQDMEDLKTVGMDIVIERFGKECSYYIGMRDFELAELKYLADAVVFTKSVTQQISEKLIEKLMCLTSVNDRGQLKRSALVRDRV